MKQGISLAVLLIVLTTYAVVVTAYSDQTQEIHRTATCAADGFCQPEIYIVRDDPGMSGSVQVDYVPLDDPHNWDLTLRNIANITADGQVNYDTRGCLEFFTDCPDTGHFRWLSSKERLVFDIDNDVELKFRIVNVPHPFAVELNGERLDADAYELEFNGLTLPNIPAGINEVVFLGPDSIVGPPEEDVFTLFEFCGLIVALFLLFLILFLLVRKIREAGGLE